MANTSAPLSEIAVANFAIGILDDVALTSLDGTSSIARFMAREFGYVRDEVIALYPWSFAITRTALAPDSDAPAFGYTYSYTLPGDCIRVLPITTNGRPNSPRIEFVREGTKLLTDYGPVLYVRYLKRVTNPAEFDPLFARALGARLAVLASTRVTGKTSYKQIANQEWQEAITQATHVDALQQGYAGTVETSATPFYGDDGTNETYAPNAVSVRGRGLVS